MPPDGVARLHRLTAVIALLLLSGCASVELADFRTVQVRADGNTAAGSISELPVRSGQVVVSESGSSLSFLMDLMASEYSPYGHAGILSVEDDGVFVYEAFGFLNVRFWEPPTRRLRGKIRRVSLASFLGRGTATAIFEHAALNLDAIEAFARSAYEQGIPFDGLFDYRTPDRVYCNEFVALALQQAGQDAIPLTPRTENDSLNQVMTWLGVDAPAFLLPSALLDGATEVARFSKRYSSQQIEAHFAFERDLHRRFTREQKLGNIFRWTRTGPRYRPHIADLHTSVMDAANAAGDEGISVQQIMQSELSTPAVLANGVSAAAGQ